MNARAPFSLYHRAPDSLLHFEMPIYLPPPEHGELRTLLNTTHYVLELPPDIFAKPLRQVGRVDFIFRRCSRRTTKRRRDAKSFLQHLAKYGCRNR